MSDDQAERKAKAKAQFNAAAADYDAGPGCFAHFGRRLVALAGIENGHRVLDVACGRGAVLFPAAEHVGQTGDVVGVDLSDEMVRRTNEEASRVGLTTQLRVMDAEHLEFPEATFDRVLCGFGIMFFPDQERALREFRRVLKPGGQLGVSTWRIDQTNEFKVVMKELDMAPPKQPGWITEPEDLSRLLMYADFTAVRVQSDSKLFRYADVDEYWRQARGTGLRRTLDALDSVQTERVRAALTERMRSYERPDGIYVEATALLALGHR